MRVINPRRTVAALAALTLVGGALAACGSGKKNEATDTPTASDTPVATADSNLSDTFVFGASDDPKIIDGGYVSDGESLRVITQIFETLVTLTPGTTEVVPGLSTKWDSSADGLTWTFELRQGVKFQDGTDFDAAAVCYNFDRWYNFKGAQQDPDTSYYWQAVFGGFATKDSDSAPDTSIYKSCDSSDATKAVISLQSPSSSFLPALVLPAFALASPAAIEKYGAGAEIDGDSVKFTGTFGTEHPTGTGPYKFVSWTPGDKLVLERNDDYWGDKALTKTLIFKAIGDGPARRQALETGEIDGYDLVSPADLSGMKDKFQLLNRPAFNIAYVGINQDKKPLDNLQVRQAIAYALDRESVIKSSYPEGAMVAKEFMPPSLWGYSNDVPEYSYDPAKAKELLKASGNPNPSIEFWMPTNVSRPYMPDPKPIYEAFKANLEDVGFKVTTKAAPWNPDYLGGVHRGEAGVYLLGWTGDWADPDNFIGVWFRNKSKDWGVNWDAQGQKIHADLTKALQEPQQANRDTMYQAINKEIMEYVPGVPYAHTEPTLAFKKGVDGYVPSPVSLEKMATVTLTKG